MEIWLIRHGTTHANLEGRFQGQLNFPLSPRGLREANFLARRLQGAGLQQLYSSNLLRAWQTAQIIALEAGLEPVKSSLLRECSWGLAEGLTRKEIKTAGLPLLTGSGGRIKAGLLSGEGDRKIQARARVFLKTAERDCSRYSRIALVSHGRFLNALMAVALGLPARLKWPFAPDPASVSIIRREVPRGGYRLALFNDRCHLV